MYFVIHTLVNEVIQDAFRNVPDKYLTSFIYCMQQFEMAFAVNSEVP
jgi:hypothetical protein